jgi:hypothetical protein
MAGRGLNTTGLDVDIYQPTVGNAIPTEVSVSADFVTLGNLHAACGFQAND